MIKRRHPQAGKLVPLSFRVTAEVRRKLEAAALANGRSLTAEAEMRLEGSFAAEAMITEALKKEALKKVDDLFSGISDLTRELKERERAVAVRERDLSKPKK
jgi:hypothetical protein